MLFINSRKKYHYIFFKNFSKLERFSLIYQIINSNSINNLIAKTIFKIKLLKNYYQLQCLLI